MSLEIYNETKKSIPEIDFLHLKNKVLGKKFELTISILNSKNSKKINWKQRKQKYIPNTLSFKYSETSGEIIFTPEIIKKETYSPPFRKGGIKKYSDKFLYLAIHSMLHLTDLDHGEKMERLEENT